MAQGYTARYLVSSGNGKDQVYLAEDYNTLAADAKRDYEGMREFQAKFIAADHRVRELTGLVVELAESQCSCAQGEKPRQMEWADVVPLGHFATWACEPNSTIEETLALVARFAN